MEDDIARVLCEDIAGVYKFATSELGSLVGQSTCFRLRKVGEPVFCADSVLVKVEVLNHLLLKHDPKTTPDVASVQGGQTALLRVRHSDWHASVQRADMISALWTHVHMDEGCIILDSTVGPAFLSARIRFHSFEVLRFAELFAGGFCGWSQAAYCLKVGGVPIHRSWMLDNAHEVLPCVQARHPNMISVTTAEELSNIEGHGDKPLYLLADFNETWWQRIWTLQPPDIVAASPPCQPWSAAGRQGGLRHPDGVLFLSLAAMAGATQVPVFCIEEVKGFMTHPDARHVMSAWSEAGYECVYREILDLAEVAPTHRTRLLMIFLHKECARGSQGAFQIATWQKVLRPSLLTQKAHFPTLPCALLHPCQLDESTKAVYLDPWYFPEAARKRDPVTFRVCTLHGQSQCFMAMYHFGHTLPESLLESKGLMGSLLRTFKEIRFFAAPEIAACHGVVEPTLFLHDDRATMRILGNSLAVPQATLALAHAVQVFPGVPHPDPASMVALSHQLRIKSDACVLLHMQHGWLLSSLDSLQDLLMHPSSRLQMERGLLAARPVFHRIDVVPIQAGNDDDVLEVFFTEHLSPQEALKAAGLQWDQGVPQLFLDKPNRVHFATVVQPPTLVLPVDIEAVPPIRHAICALTPQGVVCLHRGIPDIFAQLRWAFERASNSADAPVHCLDFYGRKLAEVRSLPGLFLIVPEDANVLFLFPCMSTAKVSAFKLTIAEDGFEVLVSPQAVEDWWLQWPGHLLPNLGWHSEFGAFPPPQGEPFCIHVRPACTILRLQPRALRKWLCELLFLAQLESRTGNERVPGELAVTLQVQSRTLADMYLPGDITPQEIECCWRTACLATGCWPGSRVFSGPFPMPYNQGIQEQPVHRIFRKRDRMYLTVMPECRGGGAKDESRQHAISRVASASLERGDPLEQASAAANALVSAAGAKACVHALQQGDTRTAWKALQDLAQAQSVQWPEADNRTERAAKRIQRAVKQRRLKSQEVATASSFRLDPSVWLGMDELPVQVLDQVALHSTGIYLTDVSETTTHDLALWAGIQSDALCIIFLGHTCPEPDSCSGPVTVPATCVVTGSRHLLSCCHHNVGSTPIRATFAANAEVDLQSTVCCSFSMQKNDLPEQVSWDEIVQGPVRAVQAAFQTAGVGKAIFNPWGRVYQAGGKPSAPHLCDTFLFRAKVPSGQVPPLLQKSGYNHVYVVPRDWDDKPLQGWRVVWLTSSRAEAVQKSLLLPSQHGLVRSKNKFGVRVPTDLFTESFKKLRPQDTVPLDVEVRELYKLGPIHIGATADGITAWAAALRWPARVLRSLGPAHWLLGASKPPPTECPCLNGAPVLLTRVPGKTQRPPVVIGRGAANFAPPQRSVVERQDDDPWAQEDPWSQYRARTANTPGGVTSPAPQPVPRPPDTANTARIQALEHGLATLQAQQAQASKDRAQDKQQVCQEFQKLRGEVQGLHTTMTSQVQASFESLRAAQTQQERQLQGSIDELKQLFLQRAADKKPRKEVNLEG